MFRIWKERAEQYFDVGPSDEGLPRRDSPNEAYVVSQLVRRIQASELVARGSIFAVIFSTAGLAWFVYDGSSVVRSYSDLRVSLDSSTEVLRAQASNISMLKADVEALKETEVNPDDRPPSAWTDHDKLSREIANLVFFATAWHFHALDEDGGWGKEQSSYGESPTTFEWTDEVNPFDIMEYVPRGLTVEGRFPWAIQAETVQQTLVDHHKWFAPRSKVTLLPNSTGVFSESYIDDGNDILQKFGELPAAQRGKFAMDGFAASKKRLRNSALKKALEGVDRKSKRAFARVRGTAENFVEILEATSSIEKDVATIREKQTGWTSQVADSWLKRLPSMLAVFFLVQVFISLYRYSSRSAAALRAQLNTLVLLGAPTAFNTETFAILSSHLHSETKADFGKTTTPSEHMVDVAKAFAGKAKKG